MSLMPFARQFSWDPFDAMPLRLLGQLIATDVDDFRNLDDRLISRSDAGLSEVKIDNKTFNVNLDCHQFKPEEIKVKLQDNKLIVHAKHEEKKDNHGGYSKREFTRTYLLPNGCVLDKMTSKLDDKGMLICHCPRDIKPESTSTNIPIQRVPSQAIKQ